MSVSNAQGIALVAALTPNANGDLPINLMPSNVAETAETLLLLIEASEADSGPG